MNILVAPDSFKGSISSREICDVVEKAILKKDFKKINNIISKKLFFEMVVIGLDNELISAYERQINKKYFMDELRKSYIIRGVKGIQFAWMPIILRKG